MAKVKKAVDAAVDAGRSVKSALNDILDMSTEARKARAAEQGYDTDRVLYHGTKSTDIDQFIPGGLSDSDTSGHGTGAMGTWFSDSVDVPNDFAGVTAFGRNGKEMAPNVIPTYSRHNNPKIYDANLEYIEVKRKIAELEKPRDDEFYIGLNKATEGLTKRFHDMTGEFEGLSYQDASEIFSSKWNDIERQYTGGASEKLKQLRQRKAQLENSGEALDPFRQFMRDIGYRPGYGWDEGRSADIAADELWDSGYDAVEIRNTEFDAPDGKFVNQYMVLNPSKIRSVNAAFDPAKRESANLLAGLGGAALVGGMASQSPEAEAGVSSFARLPGRYGDRLIEFVKNPNTLDYQRLGKEVRDEYPGMPPGTPKFRTTIDEEGNTYLWKASDAIHAQMEPEIAKEFGVSVNQNNQAKSLFGDESGFADPMTLAVTAAITGAASEFYRRRESKQSFWQQRREELSELINAGDEFIRPAMPYINSALEALDKPMQGYYGVASALGALAEGNGLDASLQRGATVARQPIEQTAQEYGGVLADEGYPIAGTALNTAMQVTGPF